MTCSFPLSIAKGAFFDAQGRDPDVRTPGLEDDFFLGADVEAAVGAGHHDVLVCRQRHVIALRLYLDFSFGGKQFHAQFWANREMASPAATVNFFMTLISALPPAVALT